MDSPLIELYKVLPKIPDLIKKPSIWKTLHVKKPVPSVERVWTEIEDNRLSLHVIHPCDVNNALYHPHPWPSAIYIADGVYDTGFGYSSTDKPPPVIMRSIIGAGCWYEMNNKDGWHYVAPVDNEPVMSIMLTGKPWDRSIPTSKDEYTLSSLSNKRKKEILTWFDKHLKEEILDEYN